MNADASVLINGAGPAGLSAAIALARRGLRVEIAEITPDRSVFGSELLLSSRGMTRRSSRKALARFSDRADQGRITNEIWGPWPMRRRRVGDGRTRRDADPRPST